MASRDAVKGDKSLSLFIKDGLCKQLAHIQLMNTASGGQKEKIRACCSPDASP